MPEATRVHLEPTINLPLSNNWGSINTEAKLLATHYQQTNLDWYNSRNTTKLAESANRVMPQFKVDGRMVFERDMEMLAPGYTQTLEPRAQYLYVHIAIRAKSITTTRRCCNLTTPACSGTGLTAVLTVLPPLTR
ncbi:organic solvent tolerance protein [Escherichia coli]|uniref:Organic solvent tolerance protein n=1 Tax=Escherichia coli TaxID=562 RepID=A0A484YJN5_ECOLX|nr:organic solvent tolerance protein [Escherichia coli]